MDLESADRCVSHQFSATDIKSTKITNSLKQKIVKIIEVDNLPRLVQLMDLQQITLLTEVGVANTNWLMLHFAARFNAVKVTEYLLKQAYRKGTDYYRACITLQTSEHLNALSLAVVHRADAVLMMLLECGGCNLYSKNSQGMTVHDMAVSCKNNMAIQVLVNRMRDGKGEQLNTNYLSSDVVAQSLKKISFAKKVSYFVTRCLCLNQLIVKCPCLNCLLHKFAIKSEDAQFIQAKRGSKMDSFLVQLIGDDRYLMPPNFIWRSLVSQKTQKKILYDLCVPQTIQQNKPLSSHVIVFQCLSERPWLVRRVIKQMNGLEAGGEEVSNKQTVVYEVTLFRCSLNAPLKVNSFVPFDSSKNQPYYIQNSQQLWPMLLQKALAKIFHGYEQLNSVPMPEQLRILTGYYTKVFAVERVKDEITDIKQRKSFPLFGAIKQFFINGFIVLLEGRTKSTLRSPNAEPNQRHYFSVININDRGSNQTILIKCGFVHPDWIQKSSKESLSLKLIKSNINSCQQMCLWFDQNAIKQHFQNVTVAFTKERNIRNDIKFAVNSSCIMEVKNMASSMQGSQGVNLIKTDSNFPLKALDVNRSYSFQAYFRVTGNNRTDQSVQFLCTDGLTENIIPIQEIKIWSIDQARILNPSPSNKYTPQLPQLVLKKGEHLCRILFEMDRPAISATGLQLTLSMFSDSQITAEFVENQFACLEWAQSLVSFVAKSWVLIPKRQTQGKDRIDYVIKKLVGSWLIGVKAESDPSVKSAKLLFKLEQGKQLIESHPKALMGQLVVTQCEYALSMTAHHGIWFSVFDHPCDQEELNNAITFKLY